jgi:hypothetical protein
MINMDYQLDFILVGSGRKMKYYPVADDSISCRSQFPFHLDYQPSSLGERHSGVEKSRKLYTLLPWPSLSCTGISK